METEPGDLSLEEELEEYMPVYDPYTLDARAELTYQKRQDYSYIYEITSG